MSIDIYEDNAGKILIVDNARDFGLIVGAIGQSQADNARVDCYGLEMSEREDYEASDIIEGAALERAISAEYSTWIGTYYGRRAGILRSENHIGNAGKLYIGVER